MEKESSGQREHETDLEMNKESCKKKFVNAKWDSEAIQLSIYLCKKVTRES